MPLQIRRGTEAQRITTTAPLSDGELLWISDLKKLFIGDGVTAISQLSPVTNFNAEDSQDATAVLFNHNDHIGINFTYDDTANKITAVVTSTSSNGTFDTVTATRLIGSLYTEDGSTQVVNGITGEVTSDTSGVHFGSVYTSNKTTKIIDGSTGEITSNTTGSHFGSVTGNLKASDGTIVFDATGSGQLTGNLSGNATSATQITTVGNTSYAGDPNQAEFFITHVNSASGPQLPQTHTALTFNQLNHTLSVDNVNANLTGNVTGNTTGYHSGDTKGSVFADDSSVIVDGIGFKLLAPLHANVISDSGTILVNATSGYISGTNVSATSLNAIQLTVGTDVNSTGVLTAFNSIGPFANLYATTANTNPSLTYNMAAGANDSPETVTTSDILGTLVFNGYNGSNYVPAVTISCSANNDSTNNGIHGRFEVKTTSDNGITSNILVFDSTGTLIVGKVASELQGRVIASDESVIIDSDTKTITGTLVGDVKGSVFADDSTMLVDGTNGVLRGHLEGTAAGVAVYADATARDAAIPSPVIGMMVVVLNSGTPKLQVNLDGTLLGWTDLN
jgi:hypothetical protein